MSRHPREDRLERATRLFSEEQAERGAQVATPHPERDRAAVDRIFDELAGKPRRQDEDAEGHEPRPTRPGCGCWTPVHHEIGCAAGLGPRLRL